MATLTLKIDGLNCGSCVARAEAALQSAPGVESAAVNLATHTAQVRYRPDAIDPASIADASTAAGYPATAPDGTMFDHEDEAHTVFRDFAIAALLTLPVFVTEMGGHLFPPLHHFLARTVGMQNLWLMQFALTTLVLVWPGAVFFRRGVPALMRLAPDMNALVALGTFAAWSFSTVVTFLPDLVPAAARAVYFEAAAVIVTLILLGRWFEARAKGQAGQAIRALMDLQPQTARVMRDGTWQERPLAEIVAGDIVAAPPGARIATDGEVVSGASHVDESMISGEPMPVQKGVGDPVIGGTINGQGALEFRATSVGADTMLSQIVAMVEAAQGTKLPVQNLVNRIAAVFVPVVMGIAVLTVLVWMIFGPSPALAQAIVAGVAVLIVACPCAMGLAVPTSIMAGSGRAAQMGVIFRQGTGLQQLQSARVVAFDKTGTLTSGKPEVVAIEPAAGWDADDLLRVAASVEVKSEHPLAQAIVAAAEGKDVLLQDVAAFQAVIGHGATARLAQDTIVLGTARFLAAEGTAVPDQVSDVVATPVHVAVNGAFAGTIRIADPVRPEAAAAVRALHDLGLETALITGDTQAVGQAVAQELGIATVVAETLPDGKVAAIESLGDHVVFVGDGINDAPALATADTGIAIGTGTDVALENADVVLVSGHLSGVVNAITLSRAVMRNIRQNLFWAFAYNAALIPVAAGVLYPLTGTLLSPMLAAGAMALSSVFVVGNALRLQRLQPALQPGATA